jgi:carboxypeptidase T
MLYPTAGDTTDWTYGEYRIWSLTIELRPSSQAEGGFILPPSQIRPTFGENLPAAFEFIGQTLEAEIETNRLQP